MKILLLSDTHGYLDSAFAERFADVEMILHAGDVGSEAVLDGLRHIAPTVAVRGTVDGGAWARELPLETVVELPGTRVAMLHIAGNPARPHPDALHLIARVTPDIFLVGHSHLPVIERKHGTLWVNPGAAGRQGWHPERTCMLLQLNGERTIDFIRLGKR
jgi:putative phosphoesterase